MKLIDIIKDNVVDFSFYRNGNLYYSVLYKGDKYEFPVPIEDVGNATLLKQDKAIIYMRYIRKAIENNTFVKGK
jgi:hypothetical protein